MQSSTTRFSNRVSDYVKYRPHYPVELIEVLHKNIGFDKSWVVADVGSGTGISTELFLNNGNKVFAVEPNKEMREAAESNFTGNANFNSINATAENTTLANAAINLIFSAQAFHWFDWPKTKIEFNRLLKPTGHIVLAWNKRDKASEFLNDYEQILNKYLAEYKDAGHKKVADDTIFNFFAPQTPHKDIIKNSQQLDLDGLKGRLRSSSYCPKEGSVYDALMNEMDKLFARYEKNGLVTFEYDCNLYWC